MKRETSPFRQKLYQVEQRSQGLLCEHIDNQPKCGVVKSDQSKWSSPILLVPGKDANLQVCVQYQRLNPTTVPETYLLLRMDDCLDSLGEAKTFTALDALWEYWQVQIKDKDKDKSTFTSHLSIIATLVSRLTYKMCPLRSNAHWTSPYLEFDG